MASKAKKRKRKTDNLWRLTDIEVGGGRQFSSTIENNCSSDELYHFKDPQDFWNNNSIKTNEG